MCERKFATKKSLELQAAQSSGEHRVPAARQDLQSQQHPEEAHEDPRQRHAVRLRPEFHAEAGASHHVDRLYFPRSVENWNTEESLRRLSKSRCESNVFYTYSWI